MYCSCSITQVRQHAKKYVVSSDLTIQKICCKASLAAHLQVVGLRVQSLHFHSASLSIFFFLQAKVRLWVKTGISIKRADEVKQRTETRGGPGGIRAHRGGGALVDGSGTPPTKQKCYRKETQLADATFRDLIFKKTF